MVKINEKYNCDGIVGYEDEQAGDGLLVYIYGNENWMGNKKNKQIEKYDIKFAKDDPTIINFDNFSLELKGFIKTPSSNNYKFTVECDDFCTISVNQMEISDNKQIYLLGGQKFQIHVKYSHSAHNLYTDQDDAYLKLFWEIEGVQNKQIVPTKYLYQCNCY